MPPRELTQQYQQLNPQDPRKGSSNQDYLGSNRLGINRYTNVPAVVEIMLERLTNLTMLNAIAWQDLEKPELQSTDRVLGVFEGQPIKPLGYFLTPVSRDDTSKSTMLAIHVSQRG